MDLAMMVRSAVSRTISEPEQEKSPRIGMVVDVSDATYITGFIPSLTEKQRYPYSRPDFLYFTEEEVLLSADQSVRPVLCPKNPAKMALHAGYAEENEDQASARLLTLVSQGFEVGEEAKESTLKLRNGSIGRSTSNEDDSLMSPTDSHSTLSSVAVPRVEAALFALLDGHAGSSSAIVASKCLHEHIKSRLVEVLDMIVHLDRQETLTFGRRRTESSYSISTENSDKMRITCDQLVIGAIEAAFVDMDEQIAADKNVWRLPGGCAALAAFVFLGKIYIANAGDSRAVLVTSESTQALSTDFTPATERRRLQTMAFYNPDLIGNFYSRLEYSRRITKHHPVLRYGVGRWFESTSFMFFSSTKILRDWFMEGWATKTVKESDLRPSMISDTFKKKRLLNTIGVSRGFGDQHLLTVDERLPIKPFLSPVPEVRVLDLGRLNSVTDKDVLIMATDGLWDVLSNDEAGMIVKSALSTIDPSDPARYSMAAQELVIAARGSPGGSSGTRWTMASGAHASCDDITVFVIPLKHCVAPPPNEEDDDDELLPISFE